jgi:Tol biopolymer transport system component
VPPNGWAIELASINGAGDDSANAESMVTDVSEDGTKVLFHTRASNLGPTDTNGHQDLYMRDLATDTTTLISRNAGGTDASTGGEGVFSPDGTKVAFLSGETDLGPSDTDFEVDIYLRDLVSGSVTRIKPAPDPCGPAHSSQPVFNGDGTKLAFVRSWWNQGSGSGDTAMDIYVHDLATGTSIVATPHAGGASCTVDAASFYPVFSPDGTKLAFYSHANDFGPPDSTPVSAFDDGGDIYLRDLVTATTTLVSVNAAGEAANDVENAPAFAANGTQVVFTTRATGLGPNDTNGDYDVYIRDLTAGTTELVSVNAAGDAAASGIASTVSPDGTRIAFQSRGNTFGPVDNDPPHFFDDYDIYVRDLTTGVTTLASPNASGTDSGDHVAAGPQWLGEDRVVFASMATNLMPDTGSDDADLFVRDLSAGTTTLVTANEDGKDSTGGGGTMPIFAVSANGSTIALRTPASDHGPNDTNGVHDIYTARYHHHADLALNATATPSELASGNQVTFDITLSSSGPETSQNPAVGLVLPTGAVDVTAGPGSESCDSTSSLPPTVVCPLDDLAPGQSATIQVQVTFEAPAGTVLETRVQAMTDTLDLDQTDNSQLIQTTITP